MIMKNSMRDTTRLLLLSLLVLSLAGCHQSVVPSAEEQQGDGCERPVRITARILPDGAPLRATDGEVKDDIDDDPDTPFDPEVKDPVAGLDESRIDHVMLYVYDKDKLIRTIFYNNPKITEGMPASAGKLEVKPFGTETGGIFTFDLMLSPGRYRFVLLVNDPKSYEEAMKGKIRDPQKIYLSQMTDERKMLNSVMLHSKNTTNATYKYKSGVHPRLIPMTGQAMLTIPKGNDDGTPKTVTPSIDLERVFAKVEFILTTANKEETEYLSPEIAKYKIDYRDYVDGSTKGRLTKGRFVDLVDTDWRAGTLEMLPSRGEYTATGRDMPEESRLYSDRTATDYQQYFHDAATYSTQVTTPYAENLDARNVFPMSGGGFDKVYHKRSKSQYSKWTLNWYYLYIPPMFINGLTKEDMPYLLIGINTTGEEIPDDAPAAAPQMTYFRLPITTLVSAAGGGIEERFEIRRNTTYSIYAAFRGGRLILNDGIKVYPWRRVDQEIPIDPDADGETLPDWNK